MTVNAVDITKRHPRNQNIYTVENILQRLTITG